MALEIERKKYIFKTKEIWFADYPHDVKGFNRVVFRDCKNMVDMPGFSRRKHTTLIVDLTKDLEQIWRNINKSCRYKIKRAKREGVKIKLNQNFEGFYEMNCLFRWTKGLPPPGITAEFMKQHGTLIISEFFGKIIAGNVYLEDENNIRYWIGASKRLEANKEKTALIGRANRLIHWEAMEYAKEKGIKEFDMGGYYTRKERDQQKEKINIFKKDFGGKLIAYYIYQKDYSKIYKFLRNTYSLKRKLL